MKTECPFMIKIRASDDGQRLVIREMVSTHNHELSKVRLQGMAFPLIKVRYSLSLYSLEFKSSDATSLKC